MKVRVLDDVERPPLQKAVFANTDPSGILIVSGERRPIRMQNSDGTGSPLVRYRQFGADVIHFRAGEGVQNHVHEGDHILFVLLGRGWVIYAGEKHDLYSGVCYLVPGSVDHAIEAHSDLVLIAVGNDHRPLDSFERMTPVRGRATTPSTTTADPDVILDKSPSGLKA